MGKDKHTFSLKSITLPDVGLYLSYYIHTFSCPVKNVYVLF